MASNTALRAICRRCRHRQTNHYQDGASAPMPAPPCRVDGCPCSAYEPDQLPTKGDR